MIKNGKITKAVQTSKKKKTLIQYIQKNNQNQSRRKNQNKIMKFVSLFRIHNNKI